MRIIEHTFYNLLKFTLLLFVLLTCIFGNTHHSVLVNASSLVHVDDVASSEAMHCPHLPAYAMISEMNAELHTLLQMFSEASRVSIGWACPTAWTHCERMSIPRAPVTCDYCSWTGITCVNGSVTRIELTSIPLAGTLPATFSLPNLKVLSLSGNVLEGTIPEFCQNLPSLEQIFLDNNHFTGTIPLCLNRDVPLRQVELGSNFLHGTIPPSLLAVPSLAILSLGFNLLDGLLPDLEAFAPSVTVLSVQNNRFLGTPTCGPKLQTLLLDHNSFTGLVPACKGTTTLTAAHNQWDCPLPVGVAWSDRTFTTCTPSQFGVRLRLAMYIMYSIATVFLLLQYIYLRKKSLQRAVQRSHSATNRTRRVNRSNHHVIPPLKKDHQEKIGIPLTVSDLSPVTPPNVSSVHSPASLFFPNDTDADNVETGYISPTSPVSRRLAQEHQAIVGSKGSSGDVHSYFPQSTSVRHSYSVRGQHKDTTHEADMRGPRQRSSQVRPSSVEDTIRNEHPVTRTSVISPTSPRTFSYPRSYGPFLHALGSSLYDDNADLSSDEE